MKNSTIKTDVYVTSLDNMKYFQGKLPTARNGFCFINRVVTLCADPHEVYADDKYGTIVVYGRKVIVTGDINRMKIFSWAE
jgi:hypothetical protein